MISKIRKKSGFVRHVLTLMTGTSVAQAIPIAISPILTRIYSPADFGLLALYMSLAIIAGIVATGRYEMAIMLPAKDDDAVNIVALSVLISIIVSALLLFLVVIFNEDITLLLNNEKISSWLYMLPVSVLVMGLYQSLNYWNSRNLTYARIAVSRMSQSAIMACTQIVSGSVSINSGLVLGQVLGQIVASLVLVKLFLRDNKSSLKAISKIKVMSLAKRYKEFPKINMWSSLLNSMSIQLPFILFGVMFGAPVVGLYALAQRILYTPMALMGASIGQVYYQQTSKLKHNKKEVKALTVRVFKRLLQIGVIPIAIILAYGDVLFSFVFGVLWSEAGEYAKYLSIWAFFVFITTPISHLLTTYEMHQQALNFNVVLLLSRAISIAIGYYLFSNVKDSVLLYGVVSAIMWGGFTLYLMRLVGVMFYDTVKYVTPYLTILVVAFFIGLYR